MKHTISLALALLGLWLLLSGHFTPLMLGFGAASIVLTVLLALRMDVVDHESHPVHLTAPLSRFWVFLTREIIIANIDVSLRVFQHRRINPQMIELPVSQKTDLGRVVYANSVTLTPGTVSVRLDHKTLVVHSLTRESVDDLQNGRMARAIPEDSLTVTNNRKVNNQNRNGK